MDAAGLKRQYEREQVVKAEIRRIIKNIDVDDLDGIAYGKLTPEVTAFIGEKVKDLERDGGFSFNYVSKSMQPSEHGGTPIFQTEAVSFGKGPVLLQLNINVDALAGKSIEDINAMFSASNKSVVNTLEEALIHESGHAKLISGRTASEIRALYNELRTLGVSEVSEIAFDDGAEALAEIEVLICRGADIRAEALTLYQTYLGGTK